jgi:hypothetical protein
VRLWFLVPGSWFLVEFTSRQWDWLDVVDGVDRVDAVEPMAN